MLRLPAKHSEPRSYKATEHYKSEQLRHVAAANIKKALEC